MVSRVSNSLAMMRMTVHEEKRTTEYELQTYCRSAETADVPDIPVHL